jgi:uncharacterized protein YgiM (DUF1202 family)
MVNVNRLFVAYLVVALVLVACATQATFAHEVSTTNTSQPATNTPAVTCTVTAFHLHVRSGPGVEYHVVGYLDYGAMVQIYGRATNADGGTWLLVARNPEQWINADYVVCR